MVPFVPELKIRSAEPKASETESNIFGRVALWKEAVLISTAGFLTHKSPYLGERAPYISCWFRAYPAFWRALPKLCKVCHPAWCHESSKGHSAILSGRLLQGEGNVVRSVNSMSLSSLLLSICYKRNSLVRSSAVWNAMTVNKAFCKLTDGDFGRSTVVGEGKSMWQ